MRWLLWCTLALVAGFGLSCAGTTTLPLTPMAPPVEFTTEEVLDYSVVSSTGVPLGPAHGAIVETKTGTIQYVIMLVKDRLAFGKGNIHGPQDEYLPIPWSHLTLSPAQRIWIVDVPNLDQAPRFDHVPDPSMNGWDQEVRRYWATL
jgi:hypothetical protein